MIGRSITSRDRTLTAPPSKSLLLLAALFLLTLPQSYEGGASLPHPHAIFQFWLHEGHLSAAHHHDEGEGDGLDHAATEPLSPAEAVVAARAAQAETPTITQMPPPYESSDGFGSDLVAWLLVLFGATAGLFVLRGLRPGLAPSPETPPPRLGTAGT